MDGIIHETEQWKLIYKGIDPKSEALRESLTTLGNGVFATRGASEMSTPIYENVESNQSENYQKPFSYPATYYNGFFDTQGTNVLDRTVTNSDLVNFPNWLPLTFRSTINDNNNEENSFQGDWVSLDKNINNIIDYEQELNLLQGLLSTSFTLKENENNFEKITKVDSKRIVNVSQKHTAAIALTITPVNWDGTLQIRSSIDGSVKNWGVSRYRDLNPYHLDITHIGEKTVNNEIFICLQSITKQSRIDVSQSVRTRVFVDDILLTNNNHKNESNYVPSYFQKVEISDNNNKIDLIITIPNIKKGQNIRIEKVLSMASSKDTAISMSLENSIISLTNSPNWKTLLTKHINAWKMLWIRCDIAITPKKFNEEELKNEEIKKNQLLASRMQLIVRLHIFHCLQVLNTNSLDRDISCPARGIHGESYRGHIFWDELFIMPFYSMKVPEVGRLIPKYRHRRLDMARINAHSKGYLGALFPWQSASDGREESQLLHLNPLNGKWGLDHSSLQVHVNIAIAYNIFRYHDATQDWDFMEIYGSEVVLEIAIMFASICKYNKKTDRYEIHNVMGPDEYHEFYPGSETAGFSNNAYTNVMVVWLLDRCLSLMNNMRFHFHEKLCSLLQIEHTDIYKWKDITKKMQVPFHKHKDKNGGEITIISQFEGYDKLLEFDWKGYSKKYGNIQRLDRILKAENDSTDNYKISKQPDTCMLFYLLTFKELHNIFNSLDYTFSDNDIINNIDYYLERTSHGSTLSYLVFASILYPLDEERGWEYYTKALVSDIDDSQGGTTAEGIHMAIMAGTVDIITKTFVGIDISRDAIGINPHIPNYIEKITFHLQYGIDCMMITSSHDKLIVKPEKGSTDFFPVFVQGVLHVVNDEKSMEIELKDDRCIWKMSQCHHCSKYIKKFSDVKHICRGCGKIYCTNCMPQDKIALLDMKGLKPLRLCNECIKRTSTKDHPEQVHDIFSHNPELKETILPMEEANQVENPPKQFDVETFSKPPLLQRKKSMVAVSNAAKFIKMLKNELEKNDSNNEEQLPLRMQLRLHPKSESSNTSNNTKTTSSSA